MKVNLDSLSVTKSVEYCYNGKEALYAAINQIQLSFELQKLNEERQKVVIQPIDLMLLDYQMPGATGLEVVKQIQNVIDGLNLEQNIVKIVEPEFVIVTAYDSPKFLKQAKNVGVD